MAAPKKTAGIAAPRAKTRVRRPGRHSKNGKPRRSPLMGPRATA
jgi:hypothetical protein